LIIVGLTLDADWTRCHDEPRPQASASGKELAADAIMNVPAFPTFQQDQT
jgi:hypothetical protein